MGLFDLSLETKDLLRVVGIFLAGVVVLCVFIRGLAAAIRALHRAWIRRKYASCRYRPEALRDNSYFEPGKVPASQVAILTPGLFRNEQVGYGMRMEDFLVVPTHVLESVDWPKKSVLVQGKGTLYLDVERFQDPLYDVSFFLLTPAQWAQVGAAKAAFLDAVVAENTRVWCTGSEGRSHGVVQQASPGFYTYSGSTLPGMSGAAYETQGGVVGMHVGASGSHNLGIASVYLWRRQLLLLAEESKRTRGVVGLQAYDNPSALMEQAKARWGAEDVNDLLFAAREGDEKITKWLDKHRGTLGVHRYHYENAGVQKAVATLLNELVEERECQCKSLLHNCEKLAGMPNISGKERSVEQPNYVGQAGDQPAVQESVGDLTVRLNGVISKVNKFEDFVEDSHSVTVRQTQQIVGLENDVSFLGKRMTVLELWAVDRGYLPTGLFSEDSAQHQAMENRRKVTPDVPKAQRKEALPLKSPIQGESRRLLPKTPPLVRHVKEMFQKKQIEHPPMIEMKEKWNQHSYFKMLRSKEHLTAEEALWMERYRRRRAEKKKKQVARRAQSSSSTSASSHT